MTDTRMWSGRYTRFSLMTIVRTRLLTGVLAGLTLALGGCTQPPLGPSLSNVPLDGITLQPTQGNATLCCCRVVGGATNKNTVPIHVTLKFAAFNDTDKNPLGTILYFIKDLQPGQRSPIDASGFLFSCSQATHIKTEVDVNGLVPFPED